MPNTERRRAETWVEPCYQPCITDRAHNRNIVGIPSRVFYSIVRDMSTVDFEVVHLVVMLLYCSFYQNEILGTRL